MEGMEKQLTAVDILYKFLYEMESFEGFDPYSFNQKDVFYKAKQMEKEQIINALMTSEVELLAWGISAEQYYNETFKSE
jgi:hypothetical protein